MVVVGVGVRHHDIVVCVTGLAQACGRGHNHVIAQPELDVLQLAGVAFMQLVALEPEGIAEKADRGAEVAVRNDR